MLSDSFDLAAVPKRGSEDGVTARGDEGKRGDSVAAYGPGAGPGGERLYNADWEREPTSGEINGYLHAAPPPDSWAVIACRTVPGNRVENCRVLGENPVGSGLGRSMREAAWQFRILPPRLGGKKMMGAWVSIRISWTRDGASAG
jgi:protein TonB